MITTQANPTSCPFRAAEALDRQTFDDIRLQMMMNFCKWDAQVGDESTLAPFPLIITTAQWTELSDLAESLSTEALAAERELLYKPELHAELGLNRRLRNVLQLPPKPTATPWGISRHHPRILRFDFHWTTEGWRISEVNADVPGGLSESSAFPRLMAAHYPSTTPAGDPAARWADVIAAAASPRAQTIALLTAPGYMEDHQVMAYLATELRARGLNPHLVNPQNIHWHNDTASLNTTFSVGAQHRPLLAAIVRFFQAEWLPLQPRQSAWQNFFTTTQTPIFNPASSILIESKRFPLAWNRLETKLPTWRTLLPETLDPRNAPWQTNPNWFLKTAFCNNGDTVITPVKQTRRLKFEIHWNPRGWIAQRRFHTLPIDSPIGQVFPCIGVYTVAGKAAGIYGRLARTPVIDYSAIDVAVLVEDEQ